MPFTDPEQWSLLQGSLVLILCAATIGLAGVRITRVVDQLADRTAIGEAAAGAVLLGASTSLGGSVLSVTAAWHGNADLATSNALGGIGVQTFFLALADMFYRRANLEHAAASVPNMMQNALLIGLLALILLGPQLPAVTVWGIHPVTPILLGFYIYGIRMVRSASDAPMWRPYITQETREDEPEDLAGVPSQARLWAEFVPLMLVLGFAGWLLEPAANTVAANTGMSHTVIGVMLTATSTSLPELVTSIAAVRRGALTLAVSGIIGGNAFDTLFLAGSDIAYREGSIYHVMPDNVIFWLVLTLIMSAILLMGLIRRERFGIGHIGMESVVIMVLYGCGVMFLLAG